MHMWTKTDRISLRRAPIVLVAKKKVLQIFNVQFGWIRCPIGRRWAQPFFCLLDRRAGRFCDLQAAQQQPNTAHPSPGREDRSQVCLENELAQGNLFHLECTTTNSPSA